MLMDVRENIQFPSSKNLEIYCERVAVAVGNLSIKIFGVDKRWELIMRMSLEWLFKLQIL